MSHQPFRIALLDGDLALRRLLKSFFAEGEIELSEQSHWRVDPDPLSADSLDLALLYDDGTDPALVESYREWRQRNPNLPSVIATKQTKLDSLDAWWQERPDDVCELGELSGSRLMRTVQWTKRLEQVDSDRRQLLESQRRLVQTDSLTGLLNREAFFKVLTQVWQNSLIPGHAIACYAINVDRFRTYNEMLGSQNADELLRQVGRYFTTFFSEFGFVGRFEGDRFHVILARADRDGAMELAQHLVDVMRSQTFEIAGHSLKLTLSIGVASLDPMMSQPEVIVEQADQAVRIAQHHGRDRVESFVEPDHFQSNSVSRDNHFWLNAKAKDLMLPCITPLMESQSLLTAVRFLLMMRIDSLPVVDDDGKLVGMLTEEDLIGRGMSSQKWTGSIASLMRRNPVCFEIDTPAHVVADFLTRVSSRRILVLSGERTVGVVSRYSILRWMRNHYIADSPDQKEATMPGTGTHISHELRNVVATMHANIRKLQDSVENPTADLSVKLLAEATRMQEMIDQMLGLSPAGHDDGVTTGTMGHLIGS